MIRRLLIASVALLLPFAGTAAAQAHEVASRCAGRVIEQPFAQFGDLADYFLAPDGDLSAGGAGWELSGAEVVAENEPYSDDAPASVWIGSGGHATSPPICVTLDDPTMRFFARSAGGPNGQLAVDVLYTDADGAPQELRIGTLNGDELTEWAPGPVLEIVANTTEMDVQFRFTAVGAGSEWLVDDVYVDPYKKG